MRFSTIRSMIKNCLLLAAVSSTFWLFMRPNALVSRNAYVYVNKWTARAVWDFVADINHLKITNPFLEEFYIVSDGGVYPDWHYSAILKENIPVLGKGESDVECIVKTLGNKFQILTTYKYCKILLCVHVNSTLTFTEEDIGVSDIRTKIAEELEIRLPYSLLWFFDDAAITESHLKRIFVIQSHLGKNKLPQQNNVIQQDL